MAQYLQLFSFTAIALVLVIAMLTLNTSIAWYRADVEKSMAYECGFDPFLDPRDPFGLSTSRQGDVAFYMVAILFLVFDVEIAFLFPWAISHRALGLTGYWVMWSFMILLIAGLFYEWHKGALDWH